jgi:hypothetical protein
MILKTYQKDPDAVKNYGINWEPWLGSETIATSSWTFPSGITNEDDSNTTTTTLVQVSGGTEGDDYELVNHIVTSGGQEDERSILIQVREIEGASAEAIRAEAYIASNTSWDAEPVLTEEEKEPLMQLALAIDVNGLSPGAVGYLETFTDDSLNIAVHQGWILKLGRAAELHEGAGQAGEHIIFDHCKAMVAYWAGQIPVSMSSAGMDSSFSTSVPNVAVW